MDIFLCDAVDYRPASVCLPGNLWRPSDLCPDSLSSKLLYDPIPVSSNGEKEEYILLFGLNTEGYTGTVADYQIFLELKKSDAVKRTQYFELRSFN